MTLSKEDTQWCILVTLDSTVDEGESERETYALGPFPTKEGARLFTENYPVPEEDQAFFNLEFSIIELQHPIPGVW